jgi:predicted DNA-binding ribbon-helix-helix protein
MSTLTIRLPDAKHARLKALAGERGISVNKLVDELANIALAQKGAMNSYALRAASGNVKRRMKLLDKLDAAFTKK